MGQCGFSVGNGVCVRAHAGGRACVAAVVHLAQALNS